MASCCNRRLHCSTNYITAALIRFHCLIREDDRGNMIAVKDISRKSFLKINETQDEERFSYHTQMIRCSRMCSFYSENSWICFMVRWENVGRFRTYTCLLERTPPSHPHLLKQQMKGTIQKQTINQSVQTAIQERMKTAGIKLKVTR